MLLVSQVFFLTMNISLFANSSVVKGVSKCMCCVSSVSLPVFLYDILAYFPDNIGAREERGIRGELLFKKIMLPLRK
jgi:hypothetical protein